MYVAALQEHRESGVCWMFSADLYLGDEVRPPPSS